MTPINSAMEEADAPDASPVGAGRSYQNTTGVLLANIARMMRTHFDRRARTLGLTRAQWLALNRLSTEKGTTIGTLADWIEVEHITASRQVANLEQMGWAKRRIGIEDRRQRLVYLSEAALPVVAQVNALGSKTEDDILSVLCPDERNKLHEMLVKIHRRLSDLIEISQQAEKQVEESS